MQSGRQTIDFFGQQDRARKRSRNLVIMYVVTVLLICGAVGAVAALGAYLARPYGEAVQSLSATGGYSGASPVAFILLIAGIAVAITAMIITGGSLYRIAELRGGGSSVARGLGGRPIDPATRDLDERRVLNVVEEMAIASGVPVPPVYIMAQEPGINAFAAGYAPGDAVVGVTKGCVEGLTREELQGVIAHEFSHILNGDMRLNIRLIGMLNGIVLISLIGYTMLRVMPVAGGGRRGGSSRGGGGGGAAILVFYGTAFAMLVIGSIGALAARIMQAAVSREREFLADAAAVQFTRNPSGIAGALRRIGGGRSKARVEHPRAREAGHMFFGEALSGSSWFGSMLASHPPLTTRIKRVEPSWDGTMLAPLPPKEPKTDARKDDADTPRERLQKMMPGVLNPVAARAEALLPLIAMAGTVSSLHVAHAQNLIASIPENLRDAAHDVFGSRAVTYALLLHSDTEIREKQFSHLDVSGDPAVASMTRALAREVDALPDTLRLTLIDMTLGSLAHLSDAQHQTFRTNMRALIGMDNRVSLFEWVVLQVLTRHLDERFGLVRPLTTQYYAADRLDREISVLLSAVAHAGTDDDEAAAAAFRVGAAALSVRSATFLDRNEASLHALDAALQTLRTCSAKIKRDLLQAGAVVVAADHAVTAAEGELIRAIADILGIPTPPLLPGQQLV